MLFKINEFFNILDARGIVYCQWKSNERLETFLQGESDLDLLFYYTDKNIVTKIFDEIGAKKFELIQFSKYQNIIDYLQVDEETGKIIHYHVYFKLELGEPKIKQYSIAWSDEILLNRIKHEQSGVWIASHEHELILLILRETLRIPYLKMLLIRNSFFNFNFSRKTISEFNWLKSRVDKKKFTFISNKLFNKEKDIINTYEKIYETGFSFEKISYLFDSLKTFKKKNKIKSSYYSSYNFIKSLFKSRILLFKKSKKNKNRINPRKGLLVVIIGSDGAGKSTLIQNIKKEFGKKIDVKNFYLGSPKQKKIKILPWLKIITWLGFKPVLNLFIKKKYLINAINQRNKGLLVLCDRFPQSKYQKILDGPRVSLDKNSNNFFKQYFSTLEKKEFEKMFNSKIDVLIKLKINKDISSSRGGLPLELSERKIEAVENLFFPNCNKKYEIDTTTNSAEKIKIETMNIIWKNMN